MSITVGRRDFLVALGAAVGSPLALRAQVLRKERPLVAWLSGGTVEVAGPFAAQFLQGMQALRYVESHDFDMVYRYAEGFLERLPTLAEELVQLNPDVILAAAVSAAVPVHNVTATVPIVCPALADAVHLGLIASETRPGGNVTGIAPYVAGLPAKQIEFAREIVPGAKRVGLLTNLQDPKAPPQRQELTAAGRALEMTIVEANVDAPDEVDGAMKALAGQRVEVVIVLQTTLLLSEARRIADRALAERRPTVYGYREHVLAGGLISYGVDLRWCYRHSATFVDRILRGARAGDLPVEFPTRMMLAVNLRTASALGIAVPPTLLDVADETIE